MSTQETCKICGKVANKPYRGLSPQGEILQGCIDGFHTGALPNNTPTAAWHSRPEAVRIRLAAYKALMALNFGRAE